MTAATLTKRTVTVTTGPFAPYEQTVAIQRRISDDLVISRSTTTYWQGRSYTLQYLPEADAVGGYLGRYVGSLGYHSTEWQGTDEAVVLALQVAADEWATTVAPFI